MGHVIEGLANLGFSGGGKMGGGAAASGYGTPAPAGRGFSMSQQQIQQMMLLQQQQQQQQQQRNQASLQQQQQKQSGGLGFPLPYAGGKGSFSHFPHSGPSPDIPLQDAYLQQYLQQQQQQHQQQQHQQHQQQQQPQQHTPRSLPHHDAPTRLTSLQHRQQLQQIFQGSSTGGGAPAVGGTHYDPVSAVPSVAVHLMPDVERLLSAERSSMVNPLVDVVQDIKKWGITVTDPLEKRKIACPLFEIELTNGLLDSGSKQHTHSICILYQNNRCKVDHNCNQIHVNRAYYTRQRRGAPCCAAHHDLFTSSLLQRFLTLPKVFLVVTYGGQRQAYEWPVEYLSLSLGLAHCPVKHVKGLGDCLIIDDGKVCQVWQGSRCTYGKECNYVHVCRAHYESLPRDVARRGAGGGGGGGSSSSGGGGGVGNTNATTSPPHSSSSAGTSGTTPPNAASLLINAMLSIGGNSSGGGGGGSGGSSGGGGPVHPLPQGFQQHQLPHQHQHQHQHQQQQRLSAQPSPSAEKPSRATEGSSSCSGRSSTYESQSQTPLQTPSDTLTPPAATQPLPPGLLVYNPPASLQAGGAPAPVQAWPAQEQQQQQQQQQAQPHEASAIEAAQIAFLNQQQKQQPQPPVSQPEGSGNVMDLFASREGSPSLDVGMLAGFASLFGPGGGGGAKGGKKGAAAQPSPQPQQSTAAAAADEAAPSSGMPSLLPGAPWAPGGAKGGIDAAPGSRGGAAAASDVTPADDALPSPATEAAAWPSPDEMEAAGLGAVGPGTAAGPQAQPQVAATSGSGDERGAVAGAAAQGEPKEATHPAKEEEEEDEDDDEVIVALPSKQ